MRVLHLSIGDSFLNGGAAIAMQRLHQGLLEEDVESKILCSIKRRSSPDSIQIERSPFIDRAENLLGKFTIWFGLNDIHRLLSSIDIIRNPLVQQADVINLHCIHGGYFSYFSYLVLPLLSKRKAVAFTIHDMWPLTGHCTFSYECTRWKTGCGKCPHPEVYPSIRRDATWLEWRLKRWVFNRSTIAFICPSRWMASCARESFLNQHPVHFIPHGIRTDVFRPLDPAQCRTTLGLPLDKKLVMFAAAGLQEYRKGGDLLIAALQQLPPSLKSETALVLVGDSGENLSHAVGMECINLGKIHEDGTLAMAHAAADLFLFPTRADTFGLVAQEAIACGTPVVSFDLGGVSDIVRHNVTGYLAQADDANDFSAGICQLLQDDTLRHEMGLRCRAVALKEYTLEQSIQRHLAVYRQLLSTNGGQDLTTQQALNRCQPIQM